MGLLENADYVALDVAIAVHVVLLGQQMLALAAGVVEGER